MLDKLDILIVCPKILIKFSNFIQAELLILIIMLLLVIMYAQKLYIYLIFRYTLYIINIKEITG